MKYKKYKKAFPYSYTYGIFPTIELLKYQPKTVEKIFVHLKALNSTGVREIQELANKNHIPIESASTLIEELSNTQNNYALGVFKKYQTQMQPNQNHVVLVCPEDPGNVGTIMRTMLGFGLTNLAVIEPAVSVFDPKAIRASMGAVFQMNVSTFQDFQTYQKAFSNHHLYPFLTSAKTSLQGLTWEAPYSLIFGSESEGLSDDFQTIGTPVKIPQSDKIDSLNLSASVAIGLYQAKVIGD